MNPTRPGGGELSATLRWFVQDEHQGLGQGVASEVVGPKDSELYACSGLEKPPGVCVFPKWRRKLWGDVPRPWQEHLLPCGTVKPRGRRMSPRAGGSDLEDSIHSAVGLAREAEGHISGAGMSRRREVIPLLGLAWAKQRSERGPLLGPHPEGDLTW